MDNSTPVSSIPSIELFNADCLEYMPEIPDKSVDLILCDLPYGTTQNKWDSIIPLDKLWAEYKRLCKGAIVLTAAQPFTSLLVMHQISLFKYDLVWQKTLATGFLNANKQPLRDKEDILVFYRKQCLYNPQMSIGKYYDAQAKAGNNIQTDNYGKYGKTKSVNTGLRFPKQIISFKQERGFHPTQKPVALMEYLIKTYTNPGDVVLDNCMGSGTTGVACKNLGRAFIGIEKDPEYFKIAEERINNATPNA